MGKKNKNADKRNSAKGVIAMITNNLNKHGEIRGKNKKETKNLKAMCMHHKYTKKGKKRPMIYKSGDGERVCMLCGEKIKTKLYNKEDVKKICGDYKALLNQSKYMVAAADLGENTTSYLVKSAVAVAHFPKTYSKIKKVVEKSEHIKHKKKGNTNNDGGSNSYGSWRAN